MTYKNGAWMALMGSLLCGPLDAAAPQ